MGFDFDKALNVAEQITGTGKNLAALAGLIDPDEVVIQRPRGTRVPHAHFSDAVWFSMKPLKIKSQTKGARNENAIKIDTASSKLPVFKFLAPVEFQENIVHEYSPYESIVTRLLQKGIDATKFISEANTVIQPAQTKIDRLVQRAQKGEISTADVKNALTGIIGGMTASPVPRTKLDTPLVYQDSTRREITVEFHLVDEGNTYKDVVWPVKQLIKYSTPSYGNEELIGFDPPHIFDVSTIPGNKLIRMKYAALVGVQPIYRSPYRDGYPTLCNLTLTFREIEPLYQRRLEEEGGGTVTVSITPGVSISIGEKTDFSIANIATRKYVDQIASTKPTDAISKISKYFTKG